MVTSTNNATNGVINYYCDGSRQFVSSTCSSMYKYYYTLQYDTSNTQYSTYQDALNKAVSDGYITRDNVKNFVCFGSDESTCSTKNLYRIIGVIDGKVKLIKYDYATSKQLGSSGDYVSTSNAHYSADLGENSSSHAQYYWNKNNDTSINSGYGSNTWSTSLLNKTNLNTNFISTFSTGWQNKIEDTTWKVGGNV